MKIDLHMHSDYSLDGEFSPEQLAVLCKKSGLQTAALTDHNSVRGTEGFCRAAKEQGIFAVTGIELDCDCEDVSLHLLGYHIDSSDRRFRDLEEKVLQQKREASREEMRRIRDLDIVFDEAELMKLAREGIVVGEMIAEVALHDKRNEKNPLLLPFRPGGERSDNPYVNFYWDFCSKGKPGYVPVSYISFEDAFRLIQDTGGFAVIAHPVNTVGRREEMVSYMIDQGVAGLEVFSSYHSQPDIDYYKALTERYHVIKTCGSDFHGKTKPAVHLGGINGMTAADEEELYYLFYGKRKEGSCQL